MNKTTPEKLYARVALADPMREEILRLLFGKIEGLPFYKIKRMLNIDVDPPILLCQREAVGVLSSVRVPRLLPHEGVLDGT